MKKTVLIVIGPTASGKTSCSIELAKRLNGEIVSADSMQIYKDMYIGTAAPTAEEKQGILHHLLGFVSPDEEYNVAKYQKDAFKVIDDILKRGKVPIVTGGTGLYINSLTYDLDFTQTKGNDDIRKQIGDEYDSDPVKIYNEILNNDPAAKDRIHINDKKRVVRRVEIIRSNGVGEYNFFKYNDRYDFKLIGLLKERTKLYNDINRRVDIMMDMGLEKEVKYVYDKYGKDITAFLAIGYKEFLPYFEGSAPLEDVIYKIKQNTRHYAKRQLTWFKRDNRIHWYNVDEFIDLDMFYNQIISNLK